MASKYDKLLLLSWSFDGMSDDIPILSNVAIGNRNKIKLLGMSKNKLCLCRIFGSGPKMGSLPEVSRQNAEREFNLR
jgi:hypothetical protein